MLLNSVPKESYGVKFLQSWCTLSGMHRLVIIGCTCGCSKNIPKTNPQIKGF